MVYPFVKSCGESLKGLHRRTQRTVPCAINYRRFYEKTGLAKKQSLQKSCSTKLKFQHMLIIIGRDKLFSIHTVVSSSNNLKHQHSFHMVII